MPREPWKADELWFGKWSDGNRYPSQGTEHADILSPGLSFEHKRRAIHLTGEWFKTAIRQKDANLRDHPDKFPLVALTMHDGQGRKKRRFIVIEVDDKRWPKFDDMVIELAKKRGYDFGQNGTGESTD